MKKLMMAAAVALAAIGLNAATVNWQAQKGYLFDGAETPAKITGGSAYLMFVTASYAQDDLVSDFVAANYNSAATLTAMGESGAMATGTGTIGSNARIAASSSTYATTADASVYFVVFNGDKMFISDATDAIYDSVTSESSAAFANMTASSKLSLDATAGYSTAGWYGAVPEPTSGLLMLLGMAGLALRRKRA